jgi:hypothetical protein
MMLVEMYLFSNSHSMIARKHLILLLLHLFYYDIKRLSDLCCFSFVFCESDDGVAVRKGWFVGNLCRLGSASGPMIV